MTKIKTERTILVPLDAQGASSERLSFTAVLAQYLHASVTGLFVMDSRSLEAANLPFAFEISRFSAEERTLQHDNLAWLNRKTASETERKFRELSSRYKISVSFSTLTGDLFDSAFSQPGSDILFFPRQSVQFRQLRQIRVRNQVEELVVYYDGSSQANKSLDLAQQLYCNHLVSSLTLLYEVSPPPEAIMELRQRGIRPRLQSISTRDPFWLRSLHLSESHLVLIPREKIAGLTPSELGRLFANLKYQVLLIQ